MVRILYTLAGEGMGHATRSKAVIEELKKDNDIAIACGGKAYDFMVKNFNDVTHIKELKIVYKNNMVDSLKTMLLNIRNIPSHIRSFCRLFKKARTFKPDIIINDFEIHSSYLSLLLNIPMIIIDNEQVMTKARVKPPKGSLWDYFKSWSVVYLITPFADYRYISSFFFPKLKTKKASYCSPIIRKELHNIKSKKGKHILVYQTSDTNSKLVSTLKSINHDFIVYGLNRDTIDNNIIFREFNEKGFINDLASSKGVIINGGFCVMTEALHLKKPVLSIPVKKQFEQMLNATYLQRSGFGMSAKVATQDTVERFINKIPDYQKHLKNYTTKTNSQFFIELQSKIDELSRK